MEQNTKKEHNSDDPFYTFQKIIEDDNNSDDPKVSSLIKRSTQPNYTSRTIQQTRSFKFITSSAYRKYKF
jgi:hypothetical protein